MADFLSIDWDFFTLNRELDAEVWNDDHTDWMPGLFLYDWQMAENRNPNFESALWEIRAASLKRFGCDPANATRPMLDVQDFANEISMRWLCPAPFFVADSHAWMGPIARQFAEDISREPLTVYNFDAHHDSGYGDRRKKQELDCSNWALIGLREGWIGNYIQVYPDFRGKGEWKNPPTTLALKVEVCTWSEFLQAVPPDEEREIAGMFACRSSSWTPPWWDHTFEQLIDEFGFHSCVDCSHPEYARYDACKPRTWDWAGVDRHIDAISRLEKLTTTPPV